MCKPCDQGKHPTAAAVDAGWEDNTEPLGFAYIGSNAAALGPTLVPCPKCQSTNVGPFMSGLHCWDCGAVW